jgi:hypothetical protein
VGVTRPDSPAIVLAAVASHDQPCVVAHKIGKIATCAADAMFLHFSTCAAGSITPSQPSPIKGEGSWTSDGNSYHQIECHGNVPVVSKIGDRRN